MSTVDFTIQRGVSDTGRSRRRVVVQFDEEQFERVAANFGLFNPNFLESISRAERDYRSGRVRRVSSLREIRSKS